MMAAQQTNKVHLRAEIASGIRDCPMGCTSMGMPNFKVTINYVGPKVRLPYGGNSVTK